MDYRGPANNNGIPSSSKVENVRPTSIHDTVIKRKSDDNLHKILIGLKQNSMEIEELPNSVSKDNSPRISEYMEAEKRTHLNEPSLASKLVDAFINTCCIRNCIRGRSASDMRAANRKGEVQTSQSQESFEGDNQVSRQTTFQEIFERDNQVSRQTTFQEIFEGDNQVSHQTTFQEIFEGDCENTKEHFEKRYQPKIAKCTDKGYEEITNTKLSDFLEIKIKVQGKTCYKCYINQNDGIMLPTHAFKNKDMKKNVLDTRPLHADEMFQHIIRLVEEKTKAPFIPKEIVLYHVIHSETLGALKPYVERGKPPVTFKKGTAGYGEFMDKRLGKAFSRTLAASYPELEIPNIEVQLLEQPYSKVTTMLKCIKPKSNNELMYIRIKPRPKDISQSIDDINKSDSGSNSEKLSDSESTGQHESVPKDIQQTPDQSTERSQPAQDRFQPASFWGDRLNSYLTGSSGFHITETSQLDNSTNQINNTLETSRKEDDISFWNDSSFWNDPSVKAFLGKGSDD